MLKTIILYDREIFVKWILSKNNLWEENNNEKEKNNDYS